ncbi:hypothetical protein IMCC1989_1160 [gamma proteobacterium IMCC1989]|nr:hypothetical protein IMCC1989_1160 [gamma proteobacterium IMCC1989]
MEVSKGFYAIALSVVLAGCVSTPEPKPVSVKQEGDRDLDCKYLSAEYKGNTEAATRKIDKNNSDDGLDFVKGFLIWPGLADFNNAPGHEGNALLDRNAWLKNLAEAQNCEITDWPDQPERY